MTTFAMVTKVTLSEQNRTNEATIFDNEAWFVQKSCCADEVTLKFDDDKELYVSASFLMYASPVFKAMLTSDLEEKRNKIIKLTGKCYDDMLGFLKCMHPGILLKITSSNVAQIAPLAEEYQVDKIIAKCKEAMTIWLRRGYNFQEQDLLVKIPERHHVSPGSQQIQIHTKASRNTSKSSRGFIFGGQSPSVVPVSSSNTDRFQKDVNVCYKVLRLAMQLNYTDIEAEAVSILSYISYKYTCGECCEGLNEDVAMVSENKKMFEDLPQTMKLEICQKRLRVCDN